MITQKKSYITQPGQKPFERSKLIPNKGNITTEQFLSDVNKNKKPIPYSTKTDTFDGGSKKELTVTAPKLKPKTQVTPPTKQEVKPTQKTTTPTKQATTVNNQKTTVKPKEEVKTASKQTYLKPKGEVNMKVKLFQKMLLDEGFDLGKTADDGIWGAKTQEAFEKLQANKANYAIAMEKFKQLDEELQPKTIQAPQQFLPPRFAPASPATLPAFKKGGTMKKKSKKCSCGCAMKISKNAKGGLIESCACGCGMKKHEKGGAFIRPTGNANLNKPQAKPLLPTDKIKIKQKGGKVTTNDSIQAYNKINAGESESGKGPQTKREVINTVRKGNFGPGNTKKNFNDSLKETSNRKNKK